MTKMNTKYRLDSPLVSCVLQPCLRVPLFARALVVLFSSLLQTICLPKTSSAPYAPHLLAKHMLFLVLLFSQIFLGVLLFPWSFLFLTF